MKKKIEVETPLGGTKLDTGNKWLDAGLYIVSIVALVIVAILYFK